MSKRFDSSKASGRILSSPSFAPSPPFTCLDWQFVHNSVTRTSIRRRKRAATLAKTFATWPCQRYSESFLESAILTLRPCSPPLCVDLMATITQIARRLGVSISTVSAVINKRGYVSAAMRARIEKALREADYHPDQVARSLRNRETRTIGMIVPDLGNVFYSDLMRGAEDYLSSAGYRLIVSDSRESWDRQKGDLGLFGRTATG